MSRVRDANTMSGSTDGATIADNPTQAPLSDAIATLPAPKLTRQEKWRRKNKKAVAAYMKRWRAQKKAAVQG